MIKIYFINCVGYSLVGKLWAVSSTALIFRPHTVIQKRTHDTLSSILINKSKRNLFACLSGMAGHALYGMAPCFGHTGVTFDAENDRPGPSSIRGHFEAAQGCFLRLFA